MSSDKPRPAADETFDPSRTHTPTVLRQPANKVFGWLVAAFSRLPRPLGRALAVGVVSLWYHLWGHWRERALGNLAVAFPDAGPDEHRRLAKQAFRNLAISTVDILQAARQDHRQRIAACVNHDELRAVLKADRADGRGVVVVGAHLGNWQLASTLYATVAPTTTLVTEYKDTMFGDRLSELRERLGVSEVPATDWPLDMLRCLQRSEIVTIMADVEQRRRPGVFVPFFGRPSWMPLFPVELARLAGAVLRPVFVVRTKGGYRASIHDAIPVPGREAGHEALRDATAAWTAALEAEVRRHPEQFLWMARRWRVQPDESGIRIASRHPWRHRQPATSPPPEGHRVVDPTRAPEPEPARPTEKGATTT